ncbi:hypothetical protein GGS20DRAFT_542829 [Poronia punctata]|nr:hypothetical protein GGS20DRAFT_542829 [Poronia punctata]
MEKKMPAPTLLDLARTNVLEVVHGKTSITKRWPRKTHTTASQPPNFKTSPSLINALEALQTLQLKRDMYIDANALTVALSYLYDALPEIVRRDVDIFPSVFLPEEQDRRKGQKRFCIIPVEREGGCWVLVMMHFPSRNYVVIDPDYGREGREREDEVDRGLGFDDGRRWRPWVYPMNPPPTTTSPEKEKEKEKEKEEEKEYWPSGLHIFEMIRHWLDRMAEFNCCNPGQDVGEVETFWTHPHPGWFNPDYVRGIMIGIVASAINNTLMQGTTRLAIEPILDNALRNNVDGEDVELCPSFTESEIGRKDRIFQPQVDRERVTVIVMESDDDDDDDDDEEEEIIPEEDDVDDVDEDMSGALASYSSGGYDDVVI